jgi:hypothetical protein
MSDLTRIRPRDRDTILQSLAAGVVPRRGQPLIQVGRADEIKALIRDIERIADGGSAVRFVIGEYGSGKTFFLHLVRSMALEKGLVTMHADLTPDRRIHATGGQAQSLFSELARNVSTRSNPEGGAIASVVERFISTVHKDANDRSLNTSVVIQERLHALSELVGGYDFASVIEAYWRGHEEESGDLKEAAIRWLRAEYTTKTDVRNDLGVRNYIGDQNFYDQLKIFSRFVVLAGYSGLLVSLDEMVNLYKLSNTQARKSNYEQILRIVNDCLQGSVEHLGFIKGGTPEFLMDPRRGLYSYEALESRLAENSFAKDGLRDMNGPVIRMASLTPEELYVLLSKIRHVQASGDESKYLVPDAALTAFMDHCNKRIGARYFQTPRNTIKAFVQLLAVLEQNAGASWQELLGHVDIDDDANPHAADLEGMDVEADPSGDESDDLASFRL